MGNKLKTRFLTLRLEDELAEAIGLEAERERRTVGNLVRCLLIDALAARRGERREDA